MSHAYHDPRTRPVPVEIRALVQRLFESMGPTRAARELGVSRPVILTVIGGGPVLPGTLALLREAQHRLEVSGPVAAQGAA